MNVPQRPETILVLDTFNLLFRSFTSLPRAIVGADGMPIHAVYGMISAVQRLRRETGSDRLIAAFDVPEVPTFRHHLYPDYQGHRGPLGGEGAEEFMRQVRIARAGLPLVGIPTLFVAGYEADDIVGSLTSQARPELRFVAVSTDRDLLQLVNPHVSVLVPGGALISSVEEVIARIGVAPSDITTLKALSGDASDNIPGVRGVGPKSASALVNEYGSLENIYLHLDELTRRQQALLEAGREMAFLFRQVVTIERMVSLDIDPGLVPPVPFPRNAGVRQVLENMGQPQPVRMA